MGSFLPSGRQVQGLQDRALEGAGAGPAAKHHAVEHRGLVAVGQGPGMEGLDSPAPVQTLGGPAQGGRRHRAAEQGHRNLADLAGAEPRHEVGQGEPGPWPRRDRIIPVMD